MIVVSLDSEFENGCSKFPRKPAKFEESNFRANDEEPSKGHIRWSKEEFSLRAVEEWRANQMSSLVPLICASTVTAIKMGLGNKSYRSLTYGGGVTPNDLTRIAATGDFWTDQVLPSEKFLDLTNDGQSRYLTGENERSRKQHITQNGPKRSNRMIQRIGRMLTPTRKR